MGQLEIKKLDKYYDVNRLIKEKEYVESRLNYEDACSWTLYIFTEYISSSENHSEHHNNIPYGNILNSCPYFKKIFDSFKTEVTSFRLLRILPKTSYGLHHDKDMGDDILRFQIPIVSPKIVVIL